MKENRWEVKKIGLVNYWWYDEEEFEFIDGRMILRGTNGSGKSITMQSFIPLILDGKKTPERLDPFGNKSKKIEDYVLGYGENIKEENTSYLYMEFFKKETGNYITIGMGLKAKKGQGTNFWGFIIKDGRRIKKDFLLYKELNNKIPLTKQELRNQIGEGGRVVETQREYMQMVNENIFGFNTIEEYEEFIKLLIEIRTPKLSDGKNFKPSVVTEIISNSLRPLSDDDLRPVAESIENMNKTKEQLESLKSSKKAIDIIKKYYQTYNECVLYTKANQYAETNQNLKREQKLEAELRDIVIKHKKDMEEHNREIDALETKIKANDFKLENLRKDERFNLQKELDDLEQGLKIKIEEITEKDKKIEELKTEEIKQENILKENGQEWEKQIEEFKKKEETLSEYAKEIACDEYDFRIEEIKNNLEKRYSYDSFHKEIKRYVQKIEKGKKALEEVQIREKEYDRTLQDLDKKRDELKQKNHESTQKRLELEEEKLHFIEKMYTWEKENELFKIADERKAKIAQKVESYGDASNYDDILSNVRIPFEETNNGIMKQRMKEEHIKEGLEREKQELKEEREEWKNKKQPEPERSKKIIENRKRLDDMGIPAIPFYNAVEFKKDIDEETKNAIESALTDMGILDALIISKEAEEKIKEVDNNFIDKYLISSAPKFGRNLLEILDITIPEESKITNKEVFNVLSNIMLDETLEGTYLDEEGNYKIGLLKGKTDKCEKSKYIGKEAKKRYQEEMILKLSEEIEIKEQEIENQNTKLNELNEKLEKLEMEYKNFPKKDGLEEKHHELKVVINILQSIEEQVKTREDELREKFEQLKTAKEQVEIETKGIYFAKTLAIFNENLEIAINLKDELYELQQIHNNICNSYEKTIIIKENLEKLRENLDDLRYEFGKITKDKKELEEKKNSIESMIGKDFDEIKEQMTECLKLIKELPLTKESLIKVVARLETEISNKEERLLYIQENVNLIEAKNRVFKEILEQELNLKYVIKEYEEINKEANNILTKYHHFKDSRKELKDYAETLFIKFRENIEYVTEYNMAMEEMYGDWSAIEEDLNKGKSDNGELCKEKSSNWELHKNELRLAQNTRNRRDITCFLKGRKVNLIILSEDIEETIIEMESLIEAEDRKLFEDILTSTVGRKIRERVYHSKEWVKAMNVLMENLHTSSGLSFSLKWKPKVATDETEVDTAELVDILNSDSQVLRQEEITKIANHFRSKFARAEEKSKEKGNIIPFYNIMKETLDYRTWFEFEFLFKQGNDIKRTLTNNAFYKLSGGEKAMAMYIPLFAAVYARYENARAEAPRIISLDEAFAGVDDNNIRDMFRILTELKLEYIINSQILWGEYDTIPSLAINELISDPATQVVSVIRYRWDGNKKELVI